MPPFTATELRTWSDDGYLIVPGLLRDDEIAAFLAAPSPAAAAPGNGGGLRHHCTEAAWAALANHPAVTRRMALLCGGQPEIVQSMFLDKPAQGGRGIAMHQDEHYLPVDQPTLTACWLALTDTDADNGGLCVVPGSHRRGLLGAGENHDSDEHDAWETEHDYRDRSGRTWRARLAAVAMPDLRQDEIVALSVPPGAGVFFGGRLIHGSFANRSPDRPRRAFAIHYVASGTWVLRCDVQATVPVSSVEPSPCRTAR